MKKIFPITFLLLITISVQSQTTKEEFFRDPRNAAGLYSPYLYLHSTVTPPPSGYIPFYISHYGRHGSRWLLNANNYNNAIRILNQADSVGKLTETGKELLRKIKNAYNDATDRYGDLSPLGVKEHREIAERMYHSFPEIFSPKNGSKCFIYSRSTQVPRCILSMAANNERLKELNPQIEITRDATKKDSYLNNEPEINRDTIRSIVSAFAKKNFNAKRFINSIIADSSYAKMKIKDQADLAYNIFSIAINMFNLDYLNISMLDVFTDDEIFILWQYSNLNMYYTAGPSTVNGKKALKSAVPLLKNIINCADNAITNRNISADLRFGHDTYITPLLALMDIKNMNIQESDPEKVYLSWCNYKASPMGANLQIIFYTNSANDVVVKFLHNEKEVEIPVKTDFAPYYHWNDVKDYYEKKMLSFN